MKTIKPEETPEVKEPDLSDLEKVELFRRRMLEWPNPVEYVNNMYGCHPSDNGSDYIETIFRK